MKPMIYYRIGYCAGKEAGTVQPVAIFGYGQPHDGDGPQFHYFVQVIIKIDGSVAREDDGKRVPRFNCEIGKWVEKCAAERKVEAIEMLKALSLGCNGFNWECLKDYKEPVKPAYVYKAPPFYNEEIVPDDGLDHPVF